MYITSDTYLKNKRGIRESTKGVMSALKNGKLVATLEICCKLIYTSAVVIFQFKILIGPICLVVYGITTSLPLLVQICNMMWPYLPEALLFLLKKTMMETADQVEKDAGDQQKSQNSAPLH